MFTYKMAMFSDANEMCPKRRPVVLSIGAVAIDVAQCSVNGPVP